MARNEEKAMAMLNRWVKMKRTLNQKTREKRNELAIKKERSRLSSDQAPLTLSKRIGDYNLFHPIGRGSFGSVVLA